MGNVRITYRDCVGIQSGEIAIGPSRFARYDGERDPGDDDGHSWNNPLAHATFYDNVEKFGKQEALSLLRQDIRSFIREKKGEKTDWSLKFDGNHLLIGDGEEEVQSVLSNPITHENSALVDASIKAMVPYEISTFREAETQIAKGAKQVIIPEHSAMANGEIGARFLTILTQDETNPLIFHGSRIDLKTTTKIDKVREKFIEASRDQKAHDFHESDVEKNAFILSSKSVNDVKPFKEKVSLASGLDIKREMTHRDIQRSYADMKPGQESTRVSHAENIAFSVGGRVVRDGVRSAAVLGGYLIHEASKKIREKREKERAARTVHKDKQSSRFAEKQQKPGKLKVSKEILSQIHKKFTEFISAKKILTFVQSGVGVGAGIFVLETLTRELPKSLRNIEKKRMKMLRRKERKLVKKRESQESEKIRILAPSIKDSYKKEMRIKKQRKKDVSEALGKKVVRVEKKKISRREKKRKSNKEKRILLSKRETIIVQEQSRRPKRERRLKFVIGMLLRRLTKERVSLKNTAAKKKEKRVYSKKEMKQARVEGRIFKTAEARKKEVKMQKKKEKVMVLNFSFALAFWMLFLSESRDNNKAMILKQKGETEQSQSVQSEEPRPWILFSIIYYLAMIRESGARHSPQQKKTAKKKSKKFQKSMPQSGIIFAFPS